MLWKRLDIRISKNTNSADNAVIVSNFKKGDKLIPVFFLLKK